MNQRLKKSELLHQPQEYRQVYRAGKEQSEKGLILRSQPNNHGYCRLGIVIPKKVVSSAVVRNRLKRYLRETYRLNKHRIKGTFDLVVVVYDKGLQTLGFKQTEQLVLLLFKRQGIL